MATAAVQHSGRGWKLRAYVLGLVVVVAVSAGIGTAFERDQAVHDARSAAVGDARYAAERSAETIDDGLDLVAQTVDSTASNPQITQIFDDPTGCNLSFGGAGGFTSGHIDIVAADGRVLCTSLAKNPKTRYEGAWFRSALASKGLRGPFVDARTGRPAIAIASPIDRRGTVVAFLGLDSLGRGLADTYAGRRRLEFVVTDTEGTTILSRSIDARDWSAKPISAGGFRAADGTDRADVDGTSRLYWSETVGRTGWKVYAGADRGDALAAATRLRRPEIAVLVIGLLGSLLAALMVHRRVARPIEQLSRSVRAARDEPEAAAIAVRGPREVADLAEDFSSLLAAVQAELAERRLAEARLGASEASYRLLFDANPEPMFVHDAETGQILQVNDRAVDRYGYARDELLAMTFDELDAGLPPRGATPFGAPRPPARWSSDAHASAQAPTSVSSAAARQRTKDGRVLDVELTSHVIDFEGRPAVLVVAQDTTERDRLQQVVAQTQRLESLGQLAGGVAHDFNNLLGVILNYSAFVEDELRLGAAEPGGERWEQARNDVEKIQVAGQRAAALTHQLLAFARREVVLPAVIDLNDIATRVESLLGRTLGEHVELRVNLADDLWPIKADPGQVEQVLMNLAVNARDAMPAGGLLSIDTRNVEVDAEYASMRPGISTGRYVRLVVSDTGTGMDGSTLAHAFEPFFTTKPKGEGTGLGLATVYGIVAQAGGDIRIYSEPGYGATFTALFPATGEQALPSGVSSAPPVSRGGERVLVVEDEDALRDVTERILVRNGYQVISAANGSEALAASAATEERIDLLLTDVIMPGMLGKDVADRLTGERPGLRVLYMSGYAQPMLDVTGGLAAGVTLVEKPFSEAELLGKVREILDAGIAGAVPTADPGA